MRALTLYQPWASLVAFGGKRVETRSWGTPYRGPLLIHASVKLPRIVRELPGSFVEEAMQVLGHGEFQSLPLGKIVAVAELVEVVEIEPGVAGPRVCMAAVAWQRRDQLYHQREHAFGDYTVGRFQWRLENVRRLRHPLPARGMQGLWTPTRELAGAVHEAEVVPV